MSKYDFDLDLSLNTSTGVILNKVKKGTTILEFGCAEGRMTRYMRDELGCRVYICEYNPEAYDKAREYAEDGVCGDILAYEWREKFSDIKFDAILFIDVLEHLTDPFTVIKRAGELLAQDGRIYISIPNVTHNDILLKAIDEHFDYTSVGILDDTHVHFWGKSNLDTFVKNAGLSIEKVEATYLETGYTEQFNGLGFEKYSPYLRNLLRERECGEVYQFIISCAPREGNEEKNAVDWEFKTPSVKSKIFINKGNGFNEVDVIYFKSKFVGSGRYFAEFIIEDTDNISEIRFDPVDNEQCIIIKAQVNIDGEPLEITYPKCIIKESGVFLYGNDPMMVVSTKERRGKLSLSVEFVVLSDEFVSIVSNIAFELGDEVRNQQNDLISKDAMIAQYDELTIKKEIQINTVSRENDRLKNELNEKNTELENCKREIDQLTGDLNHYRSLFVIRVRRFCGRVLRKIKRMLSPKKQSN